MSLNRARTAVNAALSFMPAATHQRMKSTRSPVESIWKYRRASTRTWAVSPRMAASSTRCSMGAAKPESSAAARRNALSARLAWSAGSRP
jgi:hypothetical protein